MIQNDSFFIFPGQGEKSGKRGFFWQNTLLLKSGKMPSMMRFLMDPYFSTFVWHRWLHCSPAFKDHLRWNCYFLVNMQTMNLFASYSWEWRYFYANINLFSSLTCVFWNNHCHTFDTLRLRLQAWEEVYNYIALALLATNWIKRTSLIECLTWISLNWFLSEGDYQIIRTCKFKEQPLNWLGYNKLECNTAVWGFILCSKWNPNNRQCSLSSWRFYVKCSLSGVNNETFQEYIITI